MLITFKSSACANLTMLDPLAHHLLQIIGKPLSTHGVIRHDELSNAIHRLEKAIATEKCEQNVHLLERIEPCAQRLTEHETKGKAESEPLRLAQRAFPLLDMLRAAQREKANVLWGI